MKHIYLLILFLFVVVNSFSQAFITTWRTTTPNESITIPTSGVGYNYTVNWGDGNTDTAVTGNVTHAYITAGDYQVIISGTFPRIFFNLSSDRNKIISIDQWGTQQWTTMASAFKGCSNLAGQASDSPDLSILTDMSSMFNGATSFNQDIGNWNTSNVVDMSRMFLSASSFNQDIGNWDTERVFDMYGMFWDATSFNQEIGGWNTGNVQEMEAMFVSASSFNGDIGNWDVSKVRSMAYMFSSATSFNQNIGNWNTQNVNYMHQMFNSATSFNQDIGNWNTTNVTIIWEMFKNAIAFNQDIGNWNTGNVESMLQMFKDAISFNQDIGNWNTSKVKDMYGMFSGATAFNQNIGNWNVTKITQASRMFEGVTLSIANYDALLNGWNSQTINSNVTFSGGNSKYCNGETARNNMISIDGWTITDAGLDCTVSAPDCPVVISPANGDNNVSISSTITWNVASNATGYRISVGTTLGGTDIENNTDLGNVTSYTPSTNWLENTQYYVTITSYNTAGNATGCAETDFTTETLVTIPICTALIIPQDAAIDVLITSSLIWTVVTNATGYNISIGTTLGGTDIENTTDLGNVTTYTPSTNWSENTTYYVVVIAYNSAGSATGCSTTSFATEKTPVFSTDFEIPKFFTPNNDGFNDTWLIEDAESEIKDITVFNRFGKLLVQLSSNEAWDGTYSGKPLQNDDYWYVISLNSGENLKGHFSLIRK